MKCVFNRRNCKIGGLLRIGILVLMVIMVAFFGFGRFDNAMATVKSPEDLYLLSILQGAKNCYYDPPVKEQVSVTDGTFDYMSVFEKPEKEVWITTHVGGKHNTLNNNNKNDSNLTCEEVYKGYSGSVGTASGLFNGFYAAPTSIEQMGYEKKNSGTAKDVAEISFGEATIEGENYDGKSIAIDGKITCKGELKSGSWDKDSLFCKGEIEAKDNGSETSIIKIVCDDSGDCKYETKYVPTDPNTSNSDARGHISIGTDSSLADAMNEYNTILGNAFSYAIISYIDKGTDWESFGTQTNASVAFNISSGTSSGGTSIYAPIANSGTASGIMLYRLTGGANQNYAYKLQENVGGREGVNYVAYSWTTPYIYSLYFQYLTNMQKKYPTINLAECQEQKGDSGYWFKNSSNRWCEIKNVTSDIEKEFLSVVQTDTKLVGMESGFKKVLDWFNNPDNYNGMGDGDYAELSDNGSGYLDTGTADVDNATTPTSPNASGDTAVTCQNSVGAVGWAICPVLDWMGNASTELYSTYVEPRLKINPKLFQNFDGTTKNPTRDAWGTFQTIANVVFIILLLIVIFSQLTGVGIDNYGIKRILPKLMVVAILVNLSYLICVICVDLSNILGGSLKGLFDGLGASLGDIGIDTGVASTSALGNDSWLPMILTGILVTTVIVGSVSIIMNPALILTLFISVIGVAISVLFVFVLFAMRQAAIVVLTVTAPIAFVCYALPNTKKIFDKWLKAWQGLLLVYPICGLLIGGGDYVSRLILVVEKSTAGQDGNWFVIITAMVIGVVPIFFLPTMLKGSFAAMGNIGAKVAGIGKALGGKATGMARNSEFNKRTQQRGVEHQTRFRAGVDMHGNELKMGRFRRLIRGGSRSIAQAREQYTRDQNVAARRESLTSGIGFSAALVSQRKAAERDTLSDYMTWINNETKNGEDEGRLNDLYRQYMNSGEKAGAVAVARIAGRRKDTAKRFMENHIANGESSSYNKGMVDSVMKEVSTGENSGNFRESTPMGFEYASQVNRGAVGTDGSGNLMNYNDWKLQKNEAGSYSNVHDAIDHHITNTKSLVGATKGSLTELADMIENGQIDERDANTLRTLANEAIENRGRTGIWDESKADVINRIAGSASSSSAPTSTTPPDTPPATPATPAAPVAPPVVATTHMPVQARTDGSVTSENRRILFQNNGVTGFENRLSDRLLERAINESNEASRDDSSRIDINHDRNGGANGDV